MAVSRRVLGRLASRPEGPGSLGGDVAIYAAWTNASVISTQVRSSVSVGRGADNGEVWWKPFE
jgi:hypothetical protein